MSDYNTELRKDYLFTSPDYPDYTKIVSGTGSYSLNAPLMVFWPFELLELLVPPWLQTIWALYQQDGGANIVIQANPVCACKHLMDVVSYDITKVDTWYDGILRGKFGSVSFLNTTDFISHKPIQHESQFEDFVQTYNLLVSGNFGYIDRYADFTDTVAIDFKHRFPTHVAHRLTDTVRLKIRTWWLWEVRVLSLEPPPLE